MFQFFLKPLRQILDLAIDKLNKGFKNRFTPAKANPSIGAITDLARSKSSLVAENALLRQQLIVLQRQVNKPKLRPLDRLILVFLAGLLTNWRQALFIVQPETLLKWHRAGFKLFWKFKSRAKDRKPKIAQETILLIKKMASENRLWGAERIQGELLKLHIKVSKRTIQKYMRQGQSKPSPSSSQNWSTFLKNHADQIWACDFLPVNDIFFRQLYAFVIMELGSRKIVHVGVTTHPTDEWTAQQLREATRLGYHGHPLWFEDHFSPIRRPFDRYDEGRQGLEKPRFSPSPLL